MNASKFKEGDRAVFCSNEIENLIRNYCEI